MDYPFYFKHKSFEKVVDYPPFEHVVEIVDHPFLIKILIYILFWPCPFWKIKLFHPWKKWLLPLSICDRKINLFMNLLHIYKETKHWQRLETFRRSQKLVLRHMLKILKFHQLSMFHHPTSSTPLFKWSNWNWTHWHLIIRHNFNMVFGNVNFFF